MKNSEKSNLINAAKSYLAAALYEHSSSSLRYARKAVKLLEQAEALDRTKRTAFDKLINHAKNLTW